MTQPIFLNSVTSALFRILGTKKGLGFNQSPLFYWWR